ncbi:MAG: methyl-accepting chemotaxis protein [Oscillatoriaceae bacterium SKYG93]|nr:methyl-accepting chemotaxis protein [Oscillatoriaceae bacterium SKYG93]MDW8454631.1 methyl-accepting chemotaxis protein [Oscillatoriaceae cyanobacterium SKYGB_i_bin93]
MPKTVFDKIGLQSKLMAAFILMGLIVFIVGWMGNSSTDILAKHLYEISEVRLPSIVGLEMIERGLKNTYTAEIALLNTRLNNVLRQEQIHNINEYWQQINAGYKKYNSLPRTEREEKLWQNFLSAWQRWQQEHEKFMKMYKKYHREGIFNPARTQLELLSQGKASSQEMAAAIKAGILLEQMNIQIFTLSRPAFNAAETALQKVIKENEEIVIAEKQAADKTVSLIRLWVQLGTILGPVTAVILGIGLSLAIAKPLSRTIFNSIDKIASFSSELARTVEEQERIATIQANSVNETTSTLDELGHSSQQAANLAQTATVSAKQALELAYSGTSVVGQTLEAQAILKQKVGDLAERIRQLSQQARQIAVISSLVGDLANQTNILALNAAVEAVRAGEYGKGFSIVAVEIRKLADKSRESAQNIRDLVAEIQMAIDSTVGVTGEGIETVENAVQMVQKMADAFIGVSEALNKVVETNQSIALAAKQQAQALARVVDAMNNINTGARETVSGIYQTKLGTQQLSEVAVNLRAAI